MATIIDHIGKYELKSVLARTPMSTVYDGWDPAIARRVAVKLIPMSAIDDAEAGEAYARSERVFRRPDNSIILISSAWTTMARQRTTLIW